jgi:pimeloyl-ACP methyl ester carboxylesterase
MSARLRAASLSALACLVLSLILPAGAGAQAGPLAFASCRSDQVFVPVAGLQCATLTVPVDRADSSAGSIALAVQRVPASAPRQGVIVLLAGGPGQPAIPAFEGFLAPLAHEPALRGFELVAFDQRGTGQSQGLQCLETGGSHGKMPIAECGEALGLTRPFYSSQESVEDLDALRQALGGTPLSLFAVSYGGHVAGMYAHEHPQDVARMVLDSPSPLAGPDALGSERIHALRRMLDEGVCGAGACRSFTSDVYADLTKVVAKLHRHPLRTRIYNAHGRLRPAIVTEVGVLRLLSGLDLAKGTRELVPAAIAAAAHGDGAPIARLTHELQPERPGGSTFGPFAASASGGADLLSWPGEEEPLAGGAPESDAEISSALFAATYCVESQLPWSPDSPLAGRAAALHNWLAALPAGFTEPFAPATVAKNSALSICEEWPATPPAPPPPGGVSPAPTLILSGEDDLRTPYEQDLEVQAGYSDVRLLRIPDTGHSTVTTDSAGCAKDAMLEFLTAGQAPASCPGSREPQALPLPPASLKEVHAVAAHPSLADRVAAAAAMTLEDLFGQTSFSGGGLRGGDYELKPNGYALHGMVDVRGVALSGKLRVGGTGFEPKLGGHLVVRGRLDGTLTLHGRRLSGRLDGARVRTRLAVLP